MNPPNGITPGSTVTQPAAGPVANPATLPVVPQYNLVEVHAGASLIPGSSTQGQLRLVIQPSEHVRLSISAASNFSDTHDIMAQFGYRMPLTDFFDLSFLGQAGIGILSDSPSQQGRLQEQVLRNGVRYYLGATVEADANISRRIGIYFQASALAAINSSLEATPSMLRTGEDLNPNEFIISLGAGVRWGAGGPSATRVTDTTPPPPPVVNTTPIVNNEAEQNQRLDEVVAGFNQRIDEQQQAFQTQIQASERARVTEAINNAQEGINTLRTRISQLSVGIAETNHLGSGIAQITDSFEAPGSTLTADNRNNITRSLDQLESAFNASQANTPVNARLRSAFRYIVNSNPSHPRLINSIMMRLSSLETALRRNNETTLADRAANVRRQAEAFSTQNPQAITVQDLQADVQRMEGSITALETMVGTQNLQQNPNWANIRTALNAARDEVSLNYRATVAYNSFYAHLSDDRGFFNGIVRDSNTARTRFTETLSFLQGLGNNDATRGVSLAQMHSQFGQFTDNLKFNLNRFIQLHTRPALTDNAQLRSWLPAVQAAHNLACHLDANSDACHAAVNGTGQGATPPGRTPPAGRTPPGRTPPGSNPVVDNSERITALQNSAQQAATTARREVNDVRTRFNTLPANSPFRGSIEATIRQAETAASQAEAANTSAHAAGVSLADATRHNAAALRQAGIAHNKATQAATDLTEALAQANRQPPPPPPGPRIDTPPPPPAARCGDGVQNQATEQCDDGNAVATDNCDNDCHTVTHAAPPPARDAGTVPGTDAQGRPVRTRLQRVQQ